MKVTTEKNKRCYIGDAPSWLISIQSDNFFTQSRIYKHKGEYCNDHNTRRYKTLKEAIAFETKIHAEQATK